MKGHKRYRSGAWRLSVNVGIDPQTRKRRVIYETVVAPDNRVGANLADARLAELIHAVETGREVETRAPRRRGIAVAELAERWQRANRPRQNERAGDWVGCSPKTAKTNADNFRAYILPVVGRTEAARVRGLVLDDLYRMLEEDRGLSPSVVVRCHSQIRAMYLWAMREKLAAANPAMFADPPKVSGPSCGSRPWRRFGQCRRSDSRLRLLPAARRHHRRPARGARGSPVGDVDLEDRRITFQRSIAESEDGVVEKGTKADRPYGVTLGASTAEVLTLHRQRPALRRRLVRLLRRRGSDPLEPLVAVARVVEVRGEGGVKGMRLHHLRHTAASEMPMAGVPVSIAPNASAAPRPTSSRPTATSSPAPTTPPPTSMDEVLSRR